MFEYKLTFIYKTPVVLAKSTKIVLTIASRVQAVPCADPSVIFPYISLPNITSPIKS